MRTFSPLRSASTDCRPRHRAAHPRAVTLAFRSCKFMRFDTPPPTCQHLPPHLGSHQSVPYVRELGSCFILLFVLRFHVEMRSYGVCLSPTDLLHLARCSPAPSMWSQMAGFRSFFFFFFFLIAEQHFVVSQHPCLIHRLSAASILWLLVQCCCKHRAAHIFSN